MRYEYVMRKGTFNKTTFLSSIIGKAFSSPLIFCLNMVIYHLLIVLATFTLNIDVPAHVAARLSMNDINIARAEMEAVTSLMQSFSWFVFGILVFIIACDYFLLIIISKEIPSLKLTPALILVVEIPIFILAFINPYFRIGLSFFSLNTLQIFIAYRWVIKKEWTVLKFFPHGAKLPQYFFILGTYVFLFKLIWFILCKVV